MAVTMAVPIGRLSHEGIQALSFDSPWWILRHLVEKQQKGQQNLKSEDQKLSTLIDYDQFKINRFLMSFMSWTTACLKNFLNIHEDVSHSSSDPSSTGVYPYIQYITGLFHLVLSKNHQKSIALNPNPLMNHPCP